MRILPKNKWRLLVTMAVPILLSFFFHSPRWWAVELRSHSAFLFHSRVTDEIETLKFWQEWWFERYLQQISDESGVDIRFLLVPNVGGDSLETYSIKKARSLGVGRDTGRRGLLFVYDTSAQRLRLEVGAQLEGIITDAFAGYLMRDHVRSFFGAGNPQLGLFTTLLLVHNRLREGILGAQFDPTAVEFIKDTRRLAVGGGVTTSIKSDGRRPFLNSLKPSSKATRLHFAPQPDPAATYHRYLEWLALGGYATDVPLFTSLSQGYLGSLTMTRGFNDFLLFSEYNRPYRIETRDSLALLYFTSNPLVGPHFLRRTPQGWVLDIYAEILDTRNYTGEAYAWGLVESGDDFTVTFADRFVEIGSILRLAGGDNRPLPLRTNAGPTVRPAASGDPEPPTGTSVERLAVPDLAKRISSHESRPLLVMLYYTRGRNSRAVFPLLVEVARACKMAGADVLALSVDERPESVRRLPGFLRQHSADFPPIHLQPWPSGHLAGALDPMGFQIGRAFATPLVAVRNHGRVVLQAGGADQVSALTDELIQACTTTPGVVADISHAR